MNKIPPDIPSLVGIKMIHGTSPKAGINPSTVSRVIIWQRMNEIVFHTDWFTDSESDGLLVYQRISQVPANEGAVAYLFPFHFSPSQQNRFPPTSLKCFQRRPSWTGAEEISSMFGTSAGNINDCECSWSTALESKIKLKANTQSWRALILNYTTN